MITLKIIATLMAYLIFYFCRFVYKPKIISKNPSILSLGPYKFYSFILIPFGFFQSIYQILRKVKILKSSEVKHITIYTSGGIPIHLDVYNPSYIDEFEGKNSHKKCSEQDNILLVHGVNGSSNSTYIKGMANVFLKKNCRVFCFNSRGAKLPPVNNDFCHIGFTIDLKESVNYILSCHTGVLSVIGFSMGSNWTAKLFTEYSHPRVKCCVAVCCPFDYYYLHNLFKSSYYNIALNYLFSRKYKVYLKKSMIEPPNLDNLFLIDQIDSSIISLLNYSNLKDFYESSSCKDNLHKINVPFLFINADDDPLIPTQVIPKEKINENPNLGLIILKGGHLGFFTNNEETSVETIVSDFYEKIFLKQ